LVVDTSAIIAVLLGEEGWEALETLALSADSLTMSSATYVELFVVVTRRFPSSFVARLDTLLSELKISIGAFDEHQAVIAREAYRRFGKGRHPAALNFGDCFSYALAKHLNEPLLFKGEDFRQTDVLVAEI
jgi:ribonuclease VapC